MLDNHRWILLLHRLVDGELATGLGYVDDPLPGMVVMDLGAEDSIVGVVARAHGGATLVPELSNGKES